uniref:Sperm-tail PG-rich repeat containing 4 n=1 Tax=Sphenodon punctatus TaxID=8508 RepID=A0A8D0FZA7_SPHPU
TWWRLSLRPTPVPGSYAVRDFLEEAELNPVKTTYNFRGEGRKRPSIFQPMVDPTLPDVYMYIPPSFVDLAKKKSATYSFKSTARPSPTTLCYKDKNDSNSPFKFLSLTTATFIFDHRSFMFRSAVQRFPSFFFVPKTGPGPGEYEIKGKPPHALRSCFQSNMPRLMPSHTKTPGPGTYWPTRQFPKQPRTIASLGCEHSIFFSNTSGF